MNSRFKGRVQLKASAGLNSPGASKTSLFKEDIWAKRLVFLEARGIIPDFGGGLASLRTPTPLARIIKNIQGKNEGLFEKFIQNGPIHNGERGLNTVNSWKKVNSTMNKRTTVRLQSFLNRPLVLVSDILGVVIIPGGPLGTSL